MPQRVQTTSMLDREGNASATPVGGNDMVQIIVVGEGFEGCIGSEEDHAMIGFWPSIASIIDQRRTDILGQRQMQWVAPFGLRHLDACLLPLKVIKQQGSNVTHTHPQPGGQE